MIYVLVSNVVDCGFETWFCQTKHYKIGIHRFSAKHAVLRSWNKYWLAQNQDNVSERGYLQTVVSLS
jgi:hypothetical protein